MKLIFLALALALTGCATTNSTQTDTPPEVAARPAVEVEPAAVDAPAPGVRLWRDFRVGSEGRGTRRIGPVSIADNTGSVEVDGKVLEGFVYEVQDWKEYGYVLYDVLAVDNAGYYVLYLYCRDGKLTDVYWESFWDDLEYEKAVGTCSRVVEATESEVRFDPVKVPGGLVEGYTIDSNRLSLAEDGTGSVQLLGRRYDIHAFSFVGCAECNSGSLRGWDELHVMLDTEDEDCFAILYLFGDGKSGDKVQLGYGFCTEPVKDLPSTVFPARWERVDPTSQPANPGQ